MKFSDATRKRIVEHVEKTLNTTAVPEVVEAALAALSLQDFRDFGSDVYLSGITDERRRVIEHVRERGFLFEVEDLLEGHHWPVGSDPLRDL